VAINPLQIPQVGTITPDITPTLANLVNTINQGQQRQEMQRTLSQLAPGPNGQIDPTPLIRSGNMSLAQLGIGILNNQTAQARDARDFAFRQAESQRAQSNADRSFGLQERLASNKDLPSGFQRNPAGGLQPIPGGPADPSYKRQVTDRQNAPAGYKWKDPSNPEAGLEAIPGGPGEKIPAEVAARLGLAKSFLGQLPDIRKRVQAGELTGPIDGLLGQFNIGGAGELRRQISSGSESLLRNLTGAGMNIDEAKRYVSRYEPQMNDSVPTVLSKLAQLERELRSVNDVVSKGRGGSVLEPQRGAAITQEQYNALPSGTPYTAPDGSQRIKR
jgi:hypothetical protein